MPTQGLKESIVQTPDMVAVSNENSKLTFRELGETIEQLVAKLRTSRGHLVIASVLPSGPDFTALLFACLETGSVFVPLPDNLSPVAVARYLEIVQPDLIVVADLASVDTSPWTQLGVLPVEFASLLCGAAQLPVPSAAAWSDTCSLVQFTSGSTGRPKALLVQTEQLLANLHQSNQHLAPFRGQAIFCATPQFHAMGLAATHEYLSHGSPVHFASAFNPASDVKRFNHWQCQGLLASPTYCKLLLSLGCLHQDALATLSAITLGSATTSPALVSDLRRAFPDAPIHVRYGLSEAVGTLARLSIPPGELLGQSGLIGSALEGVEVQTNDQGELLARTASAVTAQLLPGGQRENLLQPDGFLATGDLAELDPQGRILLKGRKSAMIKSGGFRIHPAEIEEHLRSFPGIQDAVVVGVPDPMLEQQVVACFEPTPHGAEVNPLDLRAHCRDGLGPNKTPARYQAFDALPRTPAGKPDRVELLRILSLPQAANLPA